MLGMRRPSCPELLARAASPATSQEFLQGSEAAAADSWWCQAFGRLFSAPEGATSDDPIMEIVRRSPASAAQYLQVVMALGGLGALAVCGLSFGFLFLFWESSGFCDRPLRWWLLAHSILQVIQMPVRLVFLFTLRRAEAEGRSMEDCVTTFTASPAWRASKSISLVTYGCFVLGITWLVNAGDCSACPGIYRMTILVIAQALVRAVAALLLFRSFFPQGGAQAEDEPKVQGATAEQIEALQTLCFAPGVVEESDASCAVCLSEYTTGEHLRRLPCGHHFHCHCADEWLHRNKQCPLCRQDLDTAGSPMAKLD